MLWKNLGLVKGLGFDSWRRTGSLLPAIKVYNTREVDELVLLDIGATIEEQEPDFDLIHDMSVESFVPFTVGGGIKTTGHVRKLLLSGADKVVINTAAYSTPGLITEISKMFGSQCLVVSIDVKKAEDGLYRCYSHSGTVETTYEVVTWAKEVERLGAGEILLTSINLDGTMNGYDIDLIKKVASTVRIPVIASGGAGNYEHMYQAIKDGLASAVAAASIFHFTEQTPLEAKKYLYSKGVPVRLN